MRPAARTRASPTKNNTVQRPTRGTRRASQSARVQWPAPPLPSRLVDHENDPARYVLLQGTATLLYRRMNHSALWFPLLTYSKFTISHKLQRSLQWKTKHSAPRVPAWSPTAVLPRPNGAWLQSSDGIWYIHHGMTEWCKTRVQVAKVAKCLVIWFSRKNKKIVETQVTVIRKVSMTSLQLLRKKEEKIEKFRLRNSKQMESQAQEYEYEYECEFKYKYKLQD